MAVKLEMTKPPTHLIRSGELGEELIVVTRSELRRAELIVTAKSVNTADGIVMGAEGDYEVFTPSGEGYPVPKSVFNGTYEIRGNVGGYVVGRRLIHVRRAWPIVSPYVEFSYPSDRGTVAQSRGGWVYRCDEDDFGLINKDENLRSHAVVGTVNQLQKYDWEGRLVLTNNILGALPTLLALFALLGFASLTGITGVTLVEGIGSFLLATEGVLLLAGVLLAYWSRRDAWVLRAAYQSTTRIVNAFQVAAEMLGEKRSDLYPSMAIWRAAQSESQPQTFAGTDLRELKNELSSTIEQIRSEVRTLELREYFANVLALSSAIGVVVCILLTLFVVHAWQLEVFAIWLPTLIGALHAHNNQYQVKNRRETGQQFASELEFARKRLLQWSFDDSDVRGDEHRIHNLTSTIRLVCRMIGEYSQYQVRFAIDNCPGIPS